MKLIVDSIQKRFNDKVILSDVYLNCNEGEILGILGRNGSGKSTLLKIIFGVLKADNKFVKIGNKVVRDLNENKQLIAYLPQDDFLPKYLKVKAVFDLYDINFCKEKIIILFNRDIRKEKCGNLSGGEKRILEIYLLLNSKAKIILLDEPFNGIAPIQKTIIESIIKEKSIQKGIILTDHSYQNVLNIATKLLVIKNATTIPIQNKEDLIAVGYLPRMEISTKNK